MSPVDSNFETLLRTFARAASPLRAYGVSSGGQALAIAWLAARSNRPIVVLCPDDDTAASLATTVEALGASALGAPVVTHWLPGWDPSPYQSVSLSIRTRLARVAALSAIQHHEEGTATASPQVWFASAQASAQATIPKTVFLENRLFLKTGARLEGRDRWLLRLAAAGYSRVETVEDPGTFAVRGEIIDLFPPDRELPVRLELFDDEVEKIREFDPSTQRSVDSASHVTTMTLPPAREVLIHGENISRIREEVKSHADDAGMPRALRDPILASIAMGAHPDHSDAWAPFAYAEGATFWDHVPNEWPVVWIDSLACEQTLDRYFSEQAAASQRATENGVIVPAVSRLFSWRPEELRGRTRIYFDRLESPSSGGSARFALDSHQELLGSTGRPSLDSVQSKLRLWTKQGFRILVMSTTESQIERIRYLLHERSIACLPTGARPQPGQVALAVGSVSDGFSWPSEGWVVLTERDILGTQKITTRRRTPSAAKDWSGLQALSDLSVGDAVVHRDHGIGRYMGLSRLSLSGAPADFLLLEYANQDRLYLPVYRLNVVQKYVGSGENTALDRLGTPGFTKQKEKVKAAVQSLAIDLVKLYAERSIRPGLQLSTPEPELQEFESTFPFEETPDQRKAINAVLEDLGSGHAMDRLICGDVGYGKTEVAIRAAFVAAAGGKQVAVLVPTTILAHQHELSFRSRLKDLPFVVESVSRFKAPKDQKATLEGLASGKVDILIGTHRVLSKDVRFKNLGLVIIDEEHRFGVEHKERLKSLKVNTHVLTLTATPIPRTLHMALSGLRDISVMNTPPVDRLPIRTYVSKHDDDLIRRAIENELARGGQVFFLHNRVQGIETVAKKLQELAPHAKIGLAHGQMPEVALEEAMMAFHRRQTNLLLCTSIIESGLDVPNANTLIVNRADSFGLAQLYQIRGRVGRSQQRAYAYLLLPETGAIGEDAKRRLEVLQKFVELGSGFSIASHDLEIRGGGDLLGPQQSGHIAAVGFELYMELLEEAVREIKDKESGVVPESSSKEPEIKTPFPAFLSEAYVPDVHHRLSLYRRLSASDSETALASIESELRDRFGPPPEEAQNLLWLIRIKQLLKQSGMEGLTVGDGRISLLSGRAAKLDPARAIALVASNPDSYQFASDSKFVAKIPTTTLDNLTFALEKLLGDLGFAKT